MGAWFQDTFILFLMAYLLGKLFNSLKLEPILAYLLVGWIFKTNFPTSPLLNTSIVQTLISCGVGFIIFKALFNIPFQQFKQARPILLIGSLPFLVETGIFALFALLILKLNLASALLLASLSAALSPALAYPKLLKLPSTLTKAGQKLRLSAAVDNMLAIISVTLLLSYFNQQTLISTLFFNIGFAFVIGTSFCLIFYIVLKVCSEYQHRHVIQVGSLATCLFVGHWLCHNSQAPYFVFVLAFTLCFSLISPHKPRHPHSLNQALTKSWPMILIIIFPLIGSQIPSIQLNFLGVFWPWICCAVLCLRLALLYILNKSFSYTKPAFLASIMLPKLSLQLAFMPVLLFQNIPFAQLISSHLTIYVIFATVSGLALQYIFEKSHS